MATVINKMKKKKQKEQKDIINWKRLAKQQKKYFNNLLVSRVQEIYEPLYGSEWLTVYNNACKQGMCSECKQISE